MPTPDPAQRSAVLTQIDGLFDKLDQGTLSELEAFVLSMLVHFLSKL